jgi:hypothetical protein
MALYRFGGIESRQCGQPNCGAWPWPLCAHEEPKNRRFSQIEKTRSKVGKTGQ